MNCKQIKKKLSAYQDGQLPAEEMKIIAAHLQVCPACSSELEEMNAVWNALLTVDKIESAPFFWQKLSRSLATGSMPLRRKRIFFASPQFSLMVVVAILLMIFSLWTGFYLGKGISVYATSPEKNTAADQENVFVISSEDFISFSSASSADMYQDFLYDNNQ